VAGSAVFLVILLRVGLVGYGVNERTERFEHLLAEFDVLGTGIWAVEHLFLVREAAGEGI
jgi:hypothetical protein